MGRPFIVTATLPDDLFSWADRLRTQHFPPERNHLHAHVTLFHAFAPTLLEELQRLLPRVAREYPPARARMTGLMDLGRGTALAIESEDMLAIREAIAEHFHGALTAQDRHKIRLHITVQNKVSREEARALQDELGQKIKPRPFLFKGLELHRYLGGPWERLGAFAFRGKTGA